MSKLQILVVNEPVELPTKSGGKFKIQDAECVILNDAGEPEVVGPLSIPTEQIGNVKAGMFQGVFKWVRDYKTKRLVYELQSLTPMAAMRPATPKVV